MASFMMQAIRETTRDMTNSGLPMFGEAFDPARLRGVVEEAQLVMPRQEGVTYEKTELDGIEAELSMPSYARDDALILYIHGGGFVCGNASTSQGYAGMLAGESRIPVYSISYRLAPEDSYPAGLDDCIRAYKAILEKHPDIPICLIGESAGATLSLVTALRLRDEGVREPAAVVLNSPVMDLSGTLDHTGYGYDEITVTPAGIVDMAKAYSPIETTRTNPYVSPIFADYTGCCPLYVAWDKGETLAADSEKLVELALAARVPVEYKRYEGCFHAFAPTGRNTPESSELLDASIAFMLKHLHDQKLDYEE